MTGPRTTPPPCSTTAYKVQAILNEIDGIDHSGTHHVGTPAIFGMNFQTVSTAQKLPTSDGLTGGYLAGGLIPGPLLTRALNWLDGELGMMVAHIKTDQPGQQHGDHHLRQARPVADRPDRPDARPRRPDHRRDQRGLEPRTHPGAAAWSSSPPTTTACCSGCSDRSQAAATS